MKTKDALSDPCVCTITSTQANITCVHPTRRPKRLQTKETRRFWRDDRSKGFMRAQEKQFCQIGVNPTFEGCNYEKFYTQEMSRFNL
jgi:hypothetical protein